MKIVAGPDPFRPIARLHPTGLGLWFANWVVAHSDGDLSVDSGPSGMHVCLHLPAATDEQTVSVA